MRGYFGIGAEKISKPMNFGALLRTAHAFEASFAFTINAHARLRDFEYSDTAKSANHVPVYNWGSIEEMNLPRRCVLVGVEFDPDAIDLPEFKHPINAAYILGPERGVLSDAAKSRCASLVKIPTNFCINLSLAGAIVMYDRMMSRNVYKERFNRRR